LGNVEDLKVRTRELISVISKVEAENAAAVRSKEALEKTINELMIKNKENSEAIDIATHAIEILRQVSDQSVGQAYRFLEQSLNGALARMFKNTTRKIELVESVRGSQYPQLELVLHVGNNKKRSLKNDSGHGLAQIVSLLSVLSLIVITGSRRFMAIDEVLSGVSVENRKVVNDILWAFTEIGFQFLINEHGFVPAGSNVYHLEMVGDVSGIKQNYISTKGVYLQGDSDKEFKYSDDSEYTDSDNEYKDEEEEKTEVKERISNAVDEVISI
jgi:hypothetical protein